MTAVLHVISDRRNLQMCLSHALLQAAKGGADVIQIREKRSPASDIFALCRALKSEMEGLPAGPLLFVNDRVDVAIAAEVDGIHLSAKSLPVCVTKSVLATVNRRCTVGLSVHSLAEAIEAEGKGADYITFGHIFESESHRGEAPKGLAALARIVDRVHIPVIAIGGIQVQNVGPVLETGCSGVAVIGAVIHQIDPYDAVQKLKHQMDKVTVQPKCPFPVGGRSRVKLV